MAKKFYLFIDRGIDYGCITEECNTSEEVEAFLGEHAEGDEEDIWVIHGERFGYRPRVSRPPMLSGPDEARNAELYAKRRERASEDREKGSSPAVDGERVSNAGFFSKICIGCYCLMTVAPKSERRLCTTCSVHRD